MNEACGEVEAAPHPAGELCDARLRGELLEAGELDRFIHSAAEVGAVQTLDGAEVLDVLAGVEDRIEAGLLRDESDEPANPMGVRGDVVPIDGDATAVGPEEGRDDGDGCGLARAIGAEQAKDLASRYGEGDAVKNCRAAVALDERVDF